MRNSQFNIGKIKSEPARQAIEKEFNLIKPGDKQTHEAAKAFGEKIQYGKHETKRSITNVLPTLATSLIRKENDTTTSKMK